MCSVAHASRPQLRVAIAVDPESATNSTAAWRALIVLLTGLFSGFARLSDMSNTVATPAKTLRSSRELDRLLLLSVFLIVLFSALFSGI